MESENDAMSDDRSGSSEVLSTDSSGKNLFEGKILFTFLLMCFYFYFNLFILLVDLKK